MTEDTEAAKLLKLHLSLLRKRPSQQELREIATTPIFTMPVLKQAQTLLPQSPEPFPQYGLLAGLADVLCDKGDSEEPLCLPGGYDPRVFFNTATPSSIFICGSQGSGKSHTLSCLLENCLMPSIASKLPKPLAGLVFHYDTFISDHGGSPCEAAYLSSNHKVKVRVLCAPTNIRTIQASPLMSIR
jgi:hypothetical protein